MSKTRRKATIVCPGCQAAPGKSHKKDCWWLKRATVPEDFVRTIGTGKKDPKGQYLTHKDHAWEHERVDHPSHYGGAENPYEVIKVIEAWGLDKDFNLGNCIKYVARAGKKLDSPEVEDLKKALWYLQRAIERREKSQ